MNFAESAITNSLFYYILMNNSHEYEVGETISERISNTITRGIFQTSATGIVASMTYRSLHSMGFKNISISVLATCTLSPLILSTLEYGFLNENNNRAFQNIRNNIRNITGYANVISSVALIILGQVTAGSTMILSELARRK